MAQEDQSSVDALRESMTNLHPKDAKDVAVSAVQAAPSRTKKDIATTAVEAVPMDAKVDVATAVIQELPDEARMALTDELLQSLPAKEREDLVSRLQTIPKTEDGQEEAPLHRYREAVQSAWVDGSPQANDVQLLRDLANNELRLSPSTAAQMRHHRGDSRAPRSSSYG